MDVGCNGTTVLAIVQSVGHYGLKAHAHTVETELLAVVPLPAILHWSFAHFVVLERWNSHSRRKKSSRSAHRYTTSIAPLPATTWPTTTAAGQWV
jgi:ABC-type bacteriocin/lantibiotic exporter with double-glycine peptidase domain